MINYNSGKIDLTNLINDCKFVYKRNDLASDLDESINDQIKHQSGLSEWKQN